MKGEKGKEGMEINGPCKVLGFLTDSEMPSLTLQSILLAWIWVGQFNGRVLSWSNSCWEIAILLTHHSKTLRASMLTPFYRWGNQGEIDRLKENYVRGIVSLYGYHLMHQWASLHPSHSGVPAPPGDCLTFRHEPATPRMADRWRKRCSQGQALCPPHSSPGPGASSCLCLAGPGFHRGGLKDVDPDSKIAF